MNNKVKVAAYARVSTDFEDQLNSLATQISYFTEYIEGHEDWELVEVYYDEGITGTSTQKREGFNRMIADCEAGKINTILTKEVSRFARNTVDTLNFTRQLSQLKVNVIFLNDGIDTNDKDGELRLTIMASLAQEESRKMSERIKWGMRRRMERGKVIGRKVFYGYRLIDDKLVIVPEEAAIVRRIFNEYLYEHKGSTKIAHGLNEDNIPTAKGNVWEPTSVLVILKNNKYVGDLTQWKYYTESYLTKKRVKNREENPDIPLITLTDHHEPIISRELWDAVCKERERRADMHQSYKQRFSGNYWTSGKTKCGQCGGTYGVINGKDNGRVKLCCRTRISYGTVQIVSTNGSRKGCDNQYVVYDALGECVRAVLEQIRVSKDSIQSDLLSEIESLNLTVEPVDVEKCEAEIASLKSKKKEAIDLLLEGLISKSDLAEQNAYYDEKIAEITEKMNDFKNADAINAQKINDIKKYMDMVIANDTVDVGNTELYREIVDKLVIQSNRIVDVYLTFIPFGVRVTYELIRPNRYRKFEIKIISLEVIE